MRNIFLFFIAGIFWCTSGIAQKLSYPESIRFSEHLIEIKEFHTVPGVLRLSDMHTLQGSALDSANYFIGYSYYLAKKLDSSVVYLNKISHSSPLYDKSMLYSFMQYCYMKNYAAAAFQMNKSFADTSRLRQLYLTEFAGYALLSRNYNLFDSLSGHFDLKNYTLKSEQEELRRFAAGMKKYSNKSPVIAGGLSAVVPGLGKLYAGYRGKALSSFITVTGLAAVTYEAYYRQGFRSPQFILASTLFSVFYIGNIWGSALSVGVKQAEFFNEYDRKILINMHIDLRRAFN